MSSVKSRIWETTHKYGIDIPTIIDHARKFYAKNGDTFWGYGIKKDIFNVDIMFEVLRGGEATTPGCNNVTGHLVCNVNMDFMPKARWVLDEHKTLYPIRLTYEEFVSR